jgi:hypothetical protein
MEQKSEIQVLYYLSIETPLGYYRGMNDETTQEALDELGRAILNQELCILKLKTSEDEVLYFGEDVVKRSVISICRVNKSKPF